MMIACAPPRPAGRARVRVAAFAAGVLLAGVLAGARGGGRGGNDGRRPEVIECSAYRPAALVLVRLHAPEFDLARLLAVGRPDDAPRVEAASCDEWTRTDQAGPCRIIVEAMTPTAARAYAWRLRALPMIVDARVVAYSSHGWVVLDRDPI